jgi:hypothetical protein
MQRAGQQAARLALLVGQAAGDIAVAHAPGEFLVRPLAGTLGQVAAQAAGRVEGRRFRQQQPGQRVQARRRGARHLQLQVDGRQLGRVGQRPFGRHAHQAHPGVGQQGEGQAGVAQGQHGAGLALAGDGLLVPGAVQGPAHAVARVVVERVEVGRGVDLLQRVVQLDRAAREDHALQFQAPFGRRALGQGPVVAAVGLAQQGELRLVEAQFGNGDLASQQGKGAERKRQALRGRGSAGRHAGGVAHDHVLCHQVRPGHVVAPAARLGRRRLALPGQRQVAAQFDGPLQRFAGTRTEPGPGAVPVIGQQDDEGQRRNGQQQAQHSQADLGTA